MNCECADRRPVCVCVCVFLPAPTCLCGVGIETMALCLTASYFSPSPLSEQTQWQHTHTQLPCLPDTKTPPGLCQSVHRIPLRQGQQANNRINLLPSSCPPFPLLRQPVKRGGADRGRMGQESLFPSVSLSPGRDRKSQGWV